MGRRFLLCAALALVACPSSPPEQTAIEEPERVFSVAVETTRRATVTVPVQLSGTIRPRRDVLVSAEGNGRVVEIHADLGDVVQKGTVLARLDSEVVRAQLDQARAGLRDAEAQLALGDKAMERENTLAEGGATTEQQHFRSGVELDRAQANVESARARVVLAERAVRDAAIRAPFAGTVAARRVELGALVGAGTPAFQLVEMGTVKVGVGVPAREVTRVIVGQAAEVRVAALGRDVSGIVTHLGPQPDARTRAYPAEIEVDNPDGQLRSGMVTRVGIVVGERESILVPEDAVVDDEPPHVFVVEDERARKATVTLGRLVDGSYEVFEGIEAGDEVATLGKQHLSDQAAVSVYTLGTKTAAAE